MMIRKIDTVLGILVMIARDGMAWWGKIGMAESGVGLVCAGLMITFFLSMNVSLTQAF